MGGYLDKPIKDKNTDDGDAGGFIYGMADMQGWSKYMEDTHYLGEHLEFGFRKWSFFAVFDGHGGERVSQYAAEKMKDVLVESLSKTLGAESGDISLPVNDNEVELVKQAAKVAFQRLDDDMRKLFEEEKKQKNERENENKKEKEDDKSGSTAVCLLVSPTHLYLINCGDSRGVIVGSKNSKKEIMSTIDHKPTLPDEKKRITAAGGVVLKQRVNGCLAVSRALGDFEYKEDRENPIVSSEPEVYSWERNSEDSNEEFVVLACDGIWDVLSNEELVGFVQWKLLLKEKLSEVCVDVIDTCLSKASRDNMTMILVVFKKALEKLNTPEKKKEAEKIEKSLEALIEEAVNKLLDGVTSPDDLGVLDLFNEVKKLTDGEEKYKKFKELIPEGGSNCYLYAMRSFIEELYRKRFPEVAERERKEAEEHKCEEEEKRKQQDEEKKRNQEEEEKKCKQEEEEKKCKQEEEEKLKNGGNEPTD